MRLFGIRLWLLANLPISKPDQIIHNMAINIKYMNIQGQELLIDLYRS